MGDALSVGDDVELGVGVADGVRVLEPVVVAVWEGSGEGDSAAEPEPLAHADGARDALLAELALSLALGEALGDELSDCDGDGLSGGENVAGFEGELVPDAHADAHAERLCVRRGEADAQELAEAHGETDVAPDKERLNDSDAVGLRVSEGDAPLDAEREPHADDTLDALLDTDKVSEGDADGEALNAGDEEGLEKGLQDDGSLGDATLERYGASVALTEPHALSVPDAQGESVAVGSAVMEAQPDALSDSAAVAVENREPLTDRDVDCDPVAVYGTDADALLDSHDDACAELLLQSEAHALALELPLLDASAVGDNEPLPDVESLAATLHKSVIDGVGDSVVDPVALCSADGDAAVVAEGTRLNVGAPLVDGCTVELTLP